MPKERTPEEEQQQTAAAAKSDAAMKPASEIEPSGEKKFAVYSRTTFSSASEQEALEILRDKTGTKAHLDLAEALAENGTIREIDPQDDGVFRIPLTKDQIAYLVGTGELTMIGLVLEGVSRQVIFTVVEPQD